MDQILISHYAHRSITTTGFNTREHPYPLEPPNHRGPWTYNYNGSFNESMKINENQCALAGSARNTKELTT